MTDKEFLEWIAMRLINQYGELPSCDYVLRLQAIAKVQPDGKVTLP